MLSNLLMRVGRPQRLVKNQTGPHGGSVSAFAASSPKRSPNRLGDTVRGEIRRVRGALEKHRHANVGPKAIRARMQRTDRLLKLITLQLNGHADEDPWAEIIRQHLLNRSGHAHHQRQGDDAAGVKSIRI